MYVVGSASSCLHRLTVDRHGGQADHVSAHHSVVERQLVKHDRSLFSNRSPGFRFHYNAGSLKGSDLLNDLALLGQHCSDLASVEYHRHDRYLVNGLCIGHRQTEGSRADSVQTGERPLGAVDLRFNVSMWFRFLSII